MTNTILQDLAEVMRLRDRVPSSTWTTMTGTFVHRHHAAIEQAVRDAERYRWLRQQNNRERTADLLLHKMNFDNAIDAAMAQEKDRD